MTDINSELQRKLRASGYSLTKTRLAIFEALEHEEPLTIRELLVKLPHVDRATVYRTTELFIQLGIVERLQFGWKYKLELSDEFSPHHHHMTCLRCHRHIAIQENASLEELLHQLASNADFQATGHQIELRGYCSECQN